MSGPSPAPASSSVSADAAAPLQQPAAQQMSEMLPPPPETQVPQPEAGSSLAAPTPTTHPEPASASVPDPPAAQQVSALNQHEEDHDQHDQLQDGSPPNGHLQSQPTPNNAADHVQPPAAAAAAAAADTAPLPAPALQLPPQHQRTVYTAKLVVNLPASTSRAESQVHVNLQLQEPHERDLSLPETQVALQPHHISVIHEPVQPTPWYSTQQLHSLPMQSRTLSGMSSSAASNGAPAMPLPTPPPLHSSAVAPPASPSASAVAAAAPRAAAAAAAAAAGDAVTFAARSPAEKPTASSIAAATASIRATMHDIPDERLVAPASRPPEAEGIAKTKVTHALRECKQWAGSRPAPLTQVDRLLSRIDMFVKLHKAGQYTADPALGEAQDTMPIVYWSDLLKFGGLGSAWNEKKGRRAYKHIYADLVRHQDNPVIRPFLEHERSKSMDELEAAFEQIYGRKHNATSSTNGDAAAAAAPTSGRATPAETASGQQPATAPSVASDVPEEDALLDLAENGRAAPQLQTSPSVPPAPAASTASASRKRKRDFESTDAITELPPIPTIRTTAPATRDNDADIRTGIVGELVKNGQWSGSRPAVINSVGSLIQRVLLLVAIHEGETIGPSNEVVYWTDCVKHGGVSQAWSSKKAGRQAFKKTYADLVKYQSHPVVQQMMSHASMTDIKTAEAALLAVITGTQPPQIPPITQSPAPSTRHSSPPGASAAKRRRSTPEWSESPPADQPQAANDSSSIGGLPKPASPGPGAVPAATVSAPTAPAEGAAPEAPSSSSAVPMETQAPTSDVDELDELE